MYSISLDDENRIIRLLRAGKATEAKATIHSTIQSKKYDNKQWVRFLQFVGEEEGLEGEDTIERSRFALRCFNLAAKLNSNSRKRSIIRCLIAKAHFKLAFTFATLSEFEKALKACRIGIEFAPLLTHHTESFAEYCWDLGNELSDARKYGQAIKAYRVAIELANDREDKSIYCYSAGLVLLITGEYSRARNQFELAKKLYSDVDPQRKKEKIRLFLEAYYYLSVGRENWHQGDLSTAKHNYLLAANSFHKIGNIQFEVFLRTVAEFFNIDKQVLLAIEQSHSLGELRERMSSVREQIAGIQLPTESSFDEQAADVIMINAKKIFVNALTDSLELKEPKYSKLHTTRVSLRKHKFLNAYHALNALDSFLAELSRFHNIDEIERSMETRLLSILRRTSAMDGVLTREATDHFFINKLDQILTEVRRLQQQTEEGMEISQNILAFVQKNSRAVAFLNDQSAELKQILVDAKTQLRDIFPQKAKEAGRWYNHLEKGISITADLIQILAFLTGISSLPALANSDLAQRVTDFLRRIRSQV